jgi:hypothetical protein
VARTAEMIPLVERERTTAALATGVVVALILATGFGTTSWRVSTLPVVLAGLGVGAVSVLLGHLVSRGIFDAPQPPLPGKVLLTGGAAQGRAVGFALVPLGLVGAVTLTVGGVLQNLPELRTFFGGLVLAFALECLAHAVRASRAQRRAGVTFFVPSGVRWPVLIGGYSAYGPVTVGTPGAVPAAPAPTATEPGSEPEVSGTGRRGSTALPDSGRPAPTPPPGRPRERGRPPRR